MDDSFAKMIEEKKRKDEETIKKFKKSHVIKSLLKYMKGSWRYCILAWVFVTIEVVGEVLIPFFAAKVINIIDPQVGSMGAEQVPELVYICLIMIAMALVSCFGGVMAGFFASIALHL